MSAVYIAIAIAAALLGASGVVFMMIVLSSFTAARRGEIPVTLILVVIFYLGGEIMDGLHLPQLPDASDIRLTAPPHGL